MLMYIGFRLGRWVTLGGGWRLGRRSRMIVLRLGLLGRVGVRFGFCLVRCPLDGILRFALVSRKVGLILYTI